MMIEHVKQNHVEKVCRKTLGPPAKHSTFSTFSHFKKELFLQKGIFIITESTKGQNMQLMISVTVFCSNICLNLMCHRIGQSSYFLIGNLLIATNLLS